MTPRRPARKRTGRAGKPRGAETARATRKKLEHLPRRLTHLYEINKLFASFHTVEDTFDSALAVATETLPLRSAILIEVEDGRSKVIRWPATSESTEEMKFAQTHAQTQVTYLMGADVSGAEGSTEHQGRTALPSQAKADRKAAADRRFIVLPLVSAHRRIFGVLQLEPTGTLQKADLVFVGAIVHQLAVALDRDSAWRADIKARGVAEGLARENLRLLQLEHQAVRVRDQILAIVSHDLRNPLSTILMAAQGLARKSAAAGGDKPSEDASARILRAAQRMKRLIEDLLDFANIEGGRLKIDFQPHDPGSIVKETVASFEAAASAAGSEVKAASPPLLTKVVCDRDRVQQVLSNLVSNAIKVVPAGGQITVRADVVGVDVVFAVADTGPGISAEDQKHLFERYWRSADAHYKGSGLGLAIAQALAKAHGGRLWVESELGHGATFFLALPLTQTAGAATFSNDASPPR